MSTYDVVWPRSAKAVEIRPLAARLEEMKGAKVAFLWDYLFRGDAIWETCKEELSARFPDMEFVDHTAFGSTHGDEEHAVLAALPGPLQEMGIDAVVSGMGC